MQKYDSFFFVHVESSCLPEKQQIVILDENTAYQSIINTIHARRQKSVPLLTFRDQNLIDIQKRVSYSSILKSNTLLTRQGLNYERFICQKTAASYPAGAGGRTA